MRKNHSDLFQEKELEEFQGRLKKFAQVLADKRRREKDPDGRRSAIRNYEAKRQAKREAEDSEARKEYNRKKQAKCVAKMQEDYPKKLKKARKKWKRTERANGPKKYNGEIKLGPVFPCVCCRTNKFRHQVVLLNKEQAAKIDQKAEEIHQAIQVIYTFDTVLFAFLCVNCIYLIEFGKVRYLDI